MLVLRISWEINTISHQVADEFLYSHHQFAWQCIDTVKRNYILITSSKGCTKNQCIGKHFIPFGKCCLIQIQLFCKSSFTSFVFWWYCGVLISDLGQGKQKLVCEIGRKITVFDFVNKFKENDFWFQTFTYFSSKFLLKPTFRRPSTVLKIRYQC